MCWHKWQTYIKIELILLSFICKLPPFLDQWKLPQSLIQLSQDGPLYILRGPQIHIIFEVGRESDCRTRGCKFDPGLVPCFHGDWSLNNFYCLLLIQEGLLSVTSKSMCTKVLANCLVRLGRYSYHRFSDTCNASDTYHNIWKCV